MLGCVAPANTQAFHGMKTHDNLSPSSHLILQIPPSIFPPTNFEQQQ